jgi:hypothetical protein
MLISTYGIFKEVSGSNVFVRIKSYRRGRDNQEGWGVH